MEFRIFEFNYKKSPEILRIQRCKILKNTMFMMCDCKFFSRLRGTTRNILTGTGTIYSVSRHRRTFNRLPRMVSYGNNLAYFLNSLQLTAWHSIMMQQKTYCVYLLNPGFFSAVFFWKSTFNSKMLDFSSWLFSSSPRKFWFWKKFTFN